MSTQKSTNPLETSAPIRPTVSHRKPKANIFTVLLVISLIAVLLGILFLCLQLRRYEFKTNATGLAAATRQVEEQEVMLLAHAGTTPPIKILILNP